MEKSRSKVNKRSSRHGASGESGENDGQRLNARHPKAGKTREGSPVAGREQDESIQSKGVNVDELVVNGTDKEAMVEHAGGENPRLDSVNLRFSQALLKKLTQQAAEEGLSLEEYLTELVAEGAVLRAWEIAERKNQQHRGSGSGSNNQVGQRYNTRNNQNRKSNRGMSHGRYQSIMDDKATFLEYVRNQERNRR